MNVAIFDRIVRYVKSFKRFESYCNRLFMSDTVRNISNEERGAELTTLLKKEIVEEVEEEEFDNHYYIVRHGAFATKGEVKLLYSIFSLYMCDGNIEYLALFAVSSILWALVELVLQLCGTRKIQPMQFLGRPLPLAASLMLQGAQEGGFVCVYGIWFGDRLFSHWNYLVSTNLFMLSLILWNGRNAKNLEQNASRRCITAFWPLFALTITGIVNVIGLLYIETDRPMRMLFVMSLLGAVWTAGQVALGMRGVMHGDKPGTALETFAVLSFDVLIEIACAYLPFYFMVKLLGF